MRSLWLKLTLAFLLVSIIGIGVFAALALQRVMSLIATSLTAIKAR
jgi:hypothetical protein